MATVRFTNALKTGVLTQIQNAIDAGSAGGTIKIYTGAIPTTADTAVTSQVLLGTLTFSETCGVNASGSLTMAAITQDSAADNSGTATWARVADSSGNAFVDIDVTTIGGGGALQLNTVNIVAGGPILVSSFVIYLP